LHHEPWLCVAQLDAGRSEGKIFLAAPVSEEDLLSKATEIENVKWDRERGAISATLDKRLGNLTISSKQISKVPDEKRIEILLQALRDEGLKLIGWAEPQQEWQARVMSLANWRSEENWPDVTDARLIETANEWLAPFLISVSKRTELQRLDLNAIVQTILPWALNNKLDELAPAKLKVPSGSLIKINYFQDGQSPFMEVRLQEMFGLLETPTVNEGSTKIILHLLSPGYRPVQVTQDLKSFWQTVYHEVRNELKRRYPRHHWPEDPWTAEAVRGAVRKFKN
jgi:ATP-dependent helicase HrpB